MYSAESKQKDIDVATLNIQRNSYRYGNYQRSKVWGLANKKLWIDTIARHFPSNALEITTCRDTNGDYYNEVMDGQQRLSALFDFLDGKFPLMTAASFMKQDDLDPLADSGLYYSELSVETKHQIMSYTLRFDVYPELHPTIRGSVIRRLNRNVSFTPAEQLATYNHAAYDLAMRLVEEHPFMQQRFSFQEHAGGRYDRRQDFQAAIYLIELERNGGYCTSLRYEQLSELCRGAHDSEITETLYNSIWRKLDAISHLFSGASIRTKCDVIVLAQAIQELDNAHIDLLQSERGCLTSWFGELRMGRLSPHVGQFNAMEGIQKLVNESKQIEFWSQERSRLLAQPGLVELSLLEIQE